MIGRNKSRGGFRTVRSIPHSSVGICENQFSICVNLRKQKMPHVIPEAMIKIRNCWFETKTQILAGYGKTNPSRGDAEFAEKPQRFLLFISSVSALSDPQRSPRPLDEGFDFLFPSAHLTDFHRLAQMRNSLVSAMILMTISVRICLRMDTSFLVGTIMLMMPSARICLQSVRISTENKRPTSARDRPSEL